MEENKNTGVEQSSGNIPAAGPGGEEIIPSAENILPGQIQTKNMETHAQHLHHAPGKKIWHYFYEFLMLFLAVTLGFIVENLREDYIEHKRANIYAASLVNDLQDDTLLLNSLIKRYRLASSSIDTFISLATNNDVKDIPGGKLYWYGLWGGFISPFVSNDATFQQMKSSGSLRYIENRELGHKIAMYDQQVRKVQMMLEQDRPIYIETRKARARIFDFRFNKAANDIVQKLYIEMANGNSLDWSPVDSFNRTNPPLMSYDKLVLNEYIELCRSRFISRLTDNLDILLLLSNEIIADLKKEYHLK